MKFAFLAAAAIVATPLAAQTTPAPDAGTTATDPAMPQSTAPATPPAAPSAMPAQDGSMSTPAPAPAGDSSTMSTGSAPGGMAGSMPADSGAPMTPPAPPAPGTPDPAGGYAPSSNTMGSMTPSQAFPPPAPMAKYPVCKPGQYDDCMQASGSGHRAATHRRKK